MDKISRFYISSTINNEFISIPLNTWTKNFEIKYKKNNLSSSIIPDLKKIYGDLLVPYEKRYSKFFTCNKYNNKCNYEANFNIVKQCDKNPDCILKEKLGYQIIKEKIYLSVEVFKKINNKNISIKNIDKYISNISQNEELKCKGLYYKSYKGIFYQDIKNPFVLLTSICNSKKNISEQSDNIATFNSHRLIISKDKIYKLSHSIIREGEFLKKSHFYLSDIIDDFYLGGSFIICKKNNLSKMCKSILRKKTSNPNLMYTQKLQSDFIEFNIQ